MRSGSGPAAVSRRTFSPRVSLAVAGKAGSRVTSRKTCFCRLSMGTASRQRVFAAGKGRHDTLSPGVRIFFSTFFMIFQGLRPPLQGGSFVLTLKRVSKNILDLEQENMLASIIKPVSYTHLTLPTT